MRELLEFAKAKTGMTTSELVNSALKRCGAIALDEYFERVSAGRGEFASRFGEEVAAYRVSSAGQSKHKSAIPSDAAEAKAQELSRIPEAPLPTEDKPPRGARTPKPSTSAPKKTTRLERATPARGCGSEGRHCALAA